MVGIPVVLNILIILIFIIVGLLEHRRLLAKDPNLGLETIHKKAPYLFVLLAIILFLFSANLILKCRQSLIWSFPLWLQFYYSTLTWGGILAIFSFIFGLASSSAFQTRHKEKWKIVVSGVLFIAAVQVAQWYYTRPVAPHLEKGVATNGVILQTSGSSCAAASAANILRFFRIEKTEKEMAELFGTTLLTGTSLAQVVFGMQKIGFSCNKAYVSDSNPESLKPPAMIFVDHPVTGPESHAMAYVEYKNGKAEILDPLSGRKFMTKEQLKKVWHGRGVEFNRISK